MSDERARISIVGLGRLGAPVAVCLAARGFEVAGYDPLPEKVEAVEARRSPGFEPALGEYYAKVGDRLRATTSLEDAVAETDVTFVAVPTPSLPDGSTSLEYLQPVCAEIGTVIAGKATDHTVVLLSTAMPGSTERRIKPTLEEAAGKEIGDGLGLCYGAVFTTVGNVAKDFLRPDMAIVGECDTRSGDVLERIYKQVCENDPPVVRMTPFNAELTKLAVNVFVATKISLANILARLCEQMPGGNVDVVTGAMQLDHRVGKGAMCGAVSYGGPFFPRDNAAFGTLMRRLNVAVELAGEMARFNRAQVPWLADFVHERLPHGGTVGVLGLSYKPNTDIITKSASVALCKVLVDRGVPLVVHDPAAMDAVKEILPPPVQFAEDPETCIGAADLVVVSTPWEAYRGLPEDAWRRRGTPRVVIDCWRVLPSLQDAEGVKYVALGTGPGTPVDPTRHGPHPPGWRKGCT